MNLPAGVVAAFGTVSRGPALDARTSRCRRIQRRANRLLKNRTLRAILPINAVARNWAVDRERRRRRGVDCGLASYLSRQTDSSGRQKFGNSNQIIGSGGQDEEPFNQAAAIAPIGEIPPNSVFAIFGFRPTRCRRHHHRHHRRSAAAAPTRRRVRVSLPVEMRRARTFGAASRRDKEHHRASRKCRRESTV